MQPINLILTQNQINPYDRMHTCIHASVRVAELSGLVHVYSMCLPRSLIPGAYAELIKEKVFKK